MQVILWPFCSQQDKQRGKFLLDSDTGVKQYRFVAEQLIAEGHGVTLVLPTGADTRLPCLCRVRRQRDVPLSNADRRVHWDTECIRRVCSGADLLVTQHETLPIPVKEMFPKLPVAVEFGMKLGTTTGGLYTAADYLVKLTLEVADKVLCLGPQLLFEAGKHTWPNKCHLWQMGFDERSIENATKDIDVVFPARCSANGYTNHKVFLEATEGMNRHVCDPTNFLDASMPLFQTAYYRVLARSRVVVGLTNNGYGGFSFQEAIASGCVPVALRSYSWLLGEDWPFYCELNAESVRECINRALLYRGALPEVHSSYQEAWRDSCRDTLLRGS